MNKGRKPGFQLPIQVIYERNMRFRLPEGARLSSICFAIPSLSSNRKVHFQKGALNQSDPKIIDNENVTLKWALQIRGAIK